MAGGVCGKCKRHHDRLTVDHIIPAHLLQQFGLLEESYGDEENYELLCKNCNGMKGSRVDPFHPKTIPLLTKYIGIMTERYGTHSIT